MARQEFPDIPEPVIVFEHDVKWYYQRVNCLGYEKEFNSHKLKRGKVRIFANGILRISEKDTKNDLIRHSEYDLNNCLWFWTKFEQCIICTFDDSLEITQSGKHYDFDAIDKLWFQLFNNDKNVSSHWETLNTIISHQRYSLSNATVCFGLLKKRSDVWKRWKDRWFVLTIRGDLIYFRDECDYNEFLQTQFIDRSAYYKMVDEYFKNKCYRIRIKNENRNQWEMKLHTIKNSTNSNSNSNSNFEFEITKHLKGNRNDFETVYRLRAMTNDEYKKWINYINMVTNEKERKEYADRIHKQYCDNDNDIDNDIDIDNGTNPKVSNAETNDYNSYNDDYNDNSRINSSINTSINGSINTTMNSTVNDHSHNTASLTREARDGNDEMRVSFPNGRNQDKRTNEMNEINETNETIETIETNETNETIEMNSQMIESAQAPQLSKSDKIEPQMPGSESLLGCNNSNQQTQIAENKQSIKDNARQRKELSKENEKEKKKENENEKEKEKQKEKQKEMKSSDSVSKWIKHMPQIVSGAFDNMDITDRCVCVLLALIVAAIVLQASFAIL